MVPLGNILLCMTPPYINVYILQRSVHAPTLSSMCILTASYFMFCSAMVIIFWLILKLMQPVMGMGLVMWSRLWWLLIQFQLSVWFTLQMVNTSY